MPYSGPNDKELPPNVKAMPEAKRRKWVRIWNAAFKNCRSSKVGAVGSVEDCEKAAFKFANGAVKEMEMDEDEGQKGRLTASGGRSLAEMFHESQGHEGDFESCPGEGCKDMLVPDPMTRKCAKCKGKGEKCSECMGPDVGYHPLAGATSFAEADSYEEANKLENHIREQEYLFRKISDNIFASEDMSLAEKLAKVKAAATELEGRLEKPEEKGLLTRIKDLISPLGVDIADKATKREDGKDFPASDYAYVPDATKPSTWKLRLTKTPGGTPDAGIVGAAIAALGKGFRGQKVQIPAADLAAVKAKVRAAWKKANPDKKPGDMPAAIKEAVGAFRAFKDADGNWRWMTLTSNMWRDRDGEIIPAEAHEENVAYANRTKDMPELWLWHVPGSRVGVADWTDFAHGFLLHSGTFDKGRESVAQSLVASKEPLGVSHGFFYEKEEGSDTYRSYRDIEVSVLPLERAANPWTEFTADNTKEVAMGLTDERRGFLVEHTSEDVVTALEKLLEEKEGALKDGNVDFKDVLVEAFEAAPAPDTKPAEGETVMVKMSEEFAKLTKGVTDKLAEIVTAQEEQGKAIKELEKSDDEKIAAKMAPRQPPPDGDRPSEDKGTEISAEEAAKRGADAKDAIDPEGLKETPGGRGLAQILKIQ